MAKFIPIDKMKSLREASKKGDERAIKILRMQLEDKEDFSPLLDEYFKPVPTQAPIEKDNNIKQEPKSDRLKQFLEDNGIKEGDERYSEYVEDYYREFPNERANTEQVVEEKHDEEPNMLDDLIKTEAECIAKYLDIIVKILDLEESDTVKKGLMSEIEDIKKDKIEHLEKLRRMKESLKKKEEKQELKEEIE